MEPGSDILGPLSMAENTMENCGERTPFFVAENKRVNDVVFLPLEVEVLSPYFFWLLLGNWGWNNTYKWSYNPFL